MSPGAGADGSPTKRMFTFPVGSVGGGLPDPGPGLTAPPVGGALAGVAQPTTSTAIASRVAKQNPPPEDRRNIASPPCGQTVHSTDT
jgi:hypothetical protein